MARLIEADALFAVVQRHHDLYKCATNPADKARRDECLQVMCDINDAPTVDAEPIGHGRWIPHPTELYWDVCSVCGTGCKRREDDNGAEAQYNYHYCPWCGAKMDGGEEQLRLIDAEALKDCFCKGPTELIYTHVVLGIIDDAPTVDAKPVKTAQLIRETDRERHWHCSRCGKVFGLVGLMHKYCPECGARLMGGGRDAD